MRKLIYSMGVPLDGYIAGPGNEIDWAGERRSGRARPCRDPDILVARDLRATTGGSEARRGSRSPRARSPAAPPAADEVLIAPSNRDALGVEVLEQRLGELARGAELIA
jgi:hypothetical protein